MTLTSNDTLSLEQRCSFLSDTGDEDFPAFPHDRQPRQLDESLPQIDSVSINMSQVMLCLVRSMPLLGRVDPG